MFKITNQLEGRIVLNSLNVILSSKGQHGDSTLIKEEDRSDREILGLERSGVLIVDKPKSTDKDSKKTQKKVKTSKPKKRRYKSGGPDGERNKATFVSEGKVKSGRMVQSIEQDGDLPSPLTADDQERDKDNSQDDIFVN
jgi:hypothetical protein